MSPIRVPRTWPWLVATGVAALAISLALTFVHGSQQQRAADDTRLLLALKQAGEDLDLGLLHVVLDAPGDSPWQRVQGLALVRQALQAVATSPLPDGVDAAALDRARSGIERLAELLADADMAARAGDARVREAMHAAHAQLRDLAGAVRRASVQQHAQDDRQFAAALLASALLLAAILAGALRSERRRAQAAAAVVARDARLRQTLGAVFEGVVTIGPQGLPIDANPAAERLLGRSLAQLQAQHRRGQPWQAFQPDGTPVPPGGMPHEQVFATGQPQHAPEIGLGADPLSRRLIEVNAVPLRDPAGALVGVVTSFRDVTDERRAMRALADAQQHLEATVQERTRQLEESLAALRESEAFAQLVTDHQPTELCYWDEQLVLRFANQAFLDSIGRRREDALGRHAEEIMGPAAFAERRPSMARVLAGETLEENEHEVTTRDGRRRWYWSIRLPFRQGGRPRGYLFVGTDITDLTLARQRLERLNDELVVERDRAESATRAKSAFLANMSHEIRTPLNAIIGLTHLMRQGDASAPPPQRLDKVADAARHLLQLVNDILDLSKIEAGQMQLESVAFSPEEVLRRTAELVQPAARDKGLRFDVALAGLPPRLVGDPTRLSQGVLNLLGNAVKFTAAGRVALAVDVADTAADGTVLLRIAVEDTGIGIAPEALQQLFRPFAQADASTTRRYGGSGLGLSIVRELARLMGGDAGAASQSGVGSRFWFTARLRPAPAVAGPEAPPTDAPPLDTAVLQGRRVLLAEDNTVNQEVATALLRGAGVQVDLARDGYEAVVAARRGGYDAILMDMQMPGMDGLAATRAIRAEQAGAAVPIIAMTANAFADDRARCLAAGMNDHVAKPLDPQAMYRTLARWCAVRA